MLVREVLRELAPLLLDLSRLKKRSRGMWMWTVGSQSTASCRWWGGGDDSGDDDDDDDDESKEQRRRKRWE